MQIIPAQIYDYLRSDVSSPAALIGCRADHSSQSLECCEYDIAVFGNFNRRVIELDGIVIEIFPFHYNESFTSLKRMIPLKDDSTLKLSSIVQKVKESRNDLILKAHGRKLISRSLFYYEKIHNTIETNPFISYLWLKIAAFNFLKGILYASGILPRPAHELDQIRKLDINNRNVLAGIKTALECTGVERATRVSLSRTREASLEIISDPVDRNLLSSKSLYLINSGKLADSYYYIASSAAKEILKRDEKYLVSYLKLLQISMDLVNDPSMVKRLHLELVKACKDTLKI